jgi:serine/threonine-protein kinase
MNADAQKARSLFLAAVEDVAPDQWGVFLEEACAGNLELRRRVEILLRAHQVSNSLFDSPAPAVVATVDDPITERPGTVIGPYKLMEQIGEGGMGLVFVAEQQQPVRRMVALKVIKPGMDTRQVIARFEAERQALAIMDHPNIAQVHDGGTTPTGRPYFVMELVKGVPITEYCDQNQVPIRERLELFLHVCQAVQHAHQKGIIHRDLKPSNVLVMSHDGTPLVKVIDFGVAKAVGQQLTDKTIYTQLSQFVGTPLYMSPEQAGQSGLDVDTRSDIYSLGVLLYELLTGTTPFDKDRLRRADYDEIRRIIREEEAATPSKRISTLGQAATTVCANRRSQPKQLSRLLRGELDWIVMKALEKDRNRRYETASAFAADVQRFLNDEVVAAGPPSGWYRFWKFARRNKTRLALAAGVLAVLIGFGGSAVWFERQKAVRQAETEWRVTAALAQAETLLDEADKETDHPQRWQATARLAQSALQKAEELLAAGSGTEELAGRVEQVRAAVEAAVDDSRLLVELNRIRLEQATVKDGHFDNAAAVPLYAELFAKYGIDVARPESAAARVRNSRLREALLSALADWSNFTPDKGEQQRVAKVYQLALPLDPLPTRVLEAARRRDSAEFVKLVNEPSFQDVPPATLINLSRGLAKWDFFAPAELVLRVGLERKPGDFWLNHELGLLLLRQQPPRAEEAIGYLRVALALRSDSPGVHVNLGMAFLRKRDPEGAIRCFRAALLIDPNYAEAHHNLGSALAAKRDLDGAIAEYQKAFRIRPSARTRYSIGNARWEKGDREGAVREYQAALRIDPNYARAHNDLGNALRQKGNIDGAIKECQAALKIDPNYALAHYNLGNALRDKGRLDEAVAAFREATRLNKDHPEAHCNLGQALVQQGRFQQAVQALRVGHKLGSKNPRWPYPSARWLANAERGAALDARLPKILKGEDHPADPVERRDLALLCQVHKKLYAAAARWYSEAFAAQPALAERLRTQGSRYDAACAAALAGRGEGQDAKALDAKERARLRGQALAWLRADLIAWSKLLEKDAAKAAPFVTQQMQHWLADPDFAGVRGDAALAQLPVEERQLWRKLWSDVRDTRTRAQTKRQPVEKSQAKDKQGGR